MRRAILLVVLAIFAPAIACADEPQRHVVRHGASQTEYVDRGSGPSIVMVASLGRSAADFDDLANRLAQQGFRVIYPEPWGIGRSTGTKPNPSLHDFAADVAAVIEDAQAAPAVVLGHAYGNTVARTLATDRPDLVRGVILIAASGRAPLSQDIQDAIAKASDLSLPDGQRVEYLARGYFAPGNDAAAWLPGWYPQTQAVEYQAYRTTPVDDYVTAGHAMPILDIQGAQDAIFPPSHSRDLQRELGRRVSVVVVPHAGHALVPEQPAAVDAAIVAWMQAQGFSGARTP